jgi:hypothetical protein
VRALALVLAVAAPLASAHGAEKPGPAGAAAKPAAPRHDPAKEPPPKAAAAPATLDQQREAIARALLRVAAEIQREIERGDVTALLARVPEEGLRCGGRVVPKAKVARDLRSTSSWLHGVFFGGPGYAPPPNTPASLAALFATGRDVAVLVTFQEDPGAGLAGRPCIDYRVEKLGTPGAPLCFVERGGRWWLTESLYPCG